MTGVVRSLSFHVRHTAERGAVVEFWACFDCVGVKTKAENRPPTRWPHTSCRARVTGKRALAQLPWLIVLSLSEDGIPLCNSGWTIFFIIVVPLETHGVNRRPRPRSPLGGGAHLLPGGPPSWSAEKLYLLQLVFGLSGFLLDRSRGQFALLLRSFLNLWPTQPHFLALISWWNWACLLLLLAHEHLQRTDNCFGGSPVLV